MPIIQKTQADSPARIDPSQKPRKLADLGDDVDLIFDNQTESSDGGGKRGFVRPWMVVLGLLLLGGASLFVKGSGLKTYAMCKLRPGYWERMSGPEVVGTWPTDGESNIRTTATLKVNLRNPNGELDPDSLVARNVVLIRTRDQQPIAATIATENAGALLTVKANQPLETKTQYTLLLTQGIKDGYDKTLRPFSVSFTTAGQSDPAIRFSKIALGAAQDNGFTCVVMSPIPNDRTLYAASDEGKIFRFPVLPDGTLGPAQTILSLQQQQGGPRVLTGICFDPHSTIENPILWASHGYGSFKDVPDFSGKISRISGRDLENVQDVVVNLPRSVRDHMNNQPSIGPDGALYWCQASNSAYGAPDMIWGDRPERLLNATVLRLDIKNWTAGRVIDAKTPDGGGTYDPFAKDAPLTIYAYGVRLGFDNVWHSNGRLYVPANGSAAGGNTPAFANVPSVKEVPLDEDDWLFRIEKGKYYGHPNPQYKKFVLNGGNPNAGFDFGELCLYPVGTKPEPDWQRAAYVFGRHVSANGVIEYKDVTFGGKLDKTLMVCRYNFGSGIIVLHLDNHGKVVSDDCTIEGLNGLTQPLDLTEDTTNGNLYVSEYGGRCITLLRAVPLK
jgi:hypothetical protein